MVTEISREREVAAEFAFWLLVRYHGQICFRLPCLTQTCLAYCLAQPFHFNDSYPVNFPLFQVKLKSNQHYSLDLLTSH